MSEKTKHKTSVGGQALIEGIMMRGPAGNAMAVRMPDGTIDVEVDHDIPLIKKHKFLGIPLIRGVVTYIDSMISGYKYLMKSADKSMTEEEKEEDMSKIDRWLTDHMGPAMMTVIGVISTVLGLVLALGIFMYLPTLLVDKFDEYIVRGADLSKLHPLFEGIVRIIVFVLYMWLVSRTKSIKRVFMYHGAEHKTIFCYENGLDLTVENVRKMKRFHPRCGTSFIFVILIISILLTSALVLIFPNLQSVSRPLWILLKFAILPFVTGIGYEFIKYAGKHENALVKALSAPGLLMQRITTVEPTDDIIEVGIEALKACITDNPEDDKI